MTERIDETDQCYRHPDRPTVLSCSQCGRPICPACSIDSPVGQRCPECLRTEGTQRVVQAREAFGRPRFRQAPVTFSIVGVALAIQLLAFLAPDLAERLTFDLAMWPRAVAAGEWWRMVTVVLVHGGLIHVGFNMLLTYQLGPVIERQLGSVSFAGLFLATAAAGSALMYVVAVPRALDQFGVGASGAVFGLVGAWLAPAVRRRGTSWGRNILSQLGFLLLINAAVPFIVPNVAWEAHLGGLVAGFGIGWVWTMPAVSRSETARAAVAAAVLVISLLVPRLI